MINFCGVKLVTWALWIGVIIFTQNSEADEGILVESINKVRTIEKLFQALKSLRKGRCKQEEKATDQGQIDLICI